ncbi:hypothetical protein ACQP1W_31945 [Spirillospora sp. CA-255316]
MSRNAALFAGEQADLVGMLDDVMSTVDISADIASARSALAGLGVWTVGASEELGGGGADAVLASIAFTRLGRNGRRSAGQRCRPTPP